MSIRSRIAGSVVSGLVVINGLALVNGAALGGGGAQSALASVASGRGRAAAGAQGPEARAARLAKASGHPVEVVAERTATTTVFAEPNGTMRAIITAEPTRVRRGRSWVPVDASLRRGADGTYHPVATARPLVLSGGGAARPLVSLGRGAARLSLRWPGRLPAPVVSGASATYPGVLPGVDLRITATYGGFTEVLVVRDRAAGMRLAAHPASLAISSAGLTVAPGRGGGLVARDRGGRVVYTAPAATMWGSGGVAGAGSAGAAGAAGSAGVRGRSGTDGGVPRAAVRLALLGGRVWLRPDLAMLTNPATRFPVMIDPSFSASTLNWTDPLQLFPNEANWNGANLGTDSNGVIEVGDDPVNLTAARAMFQMNTVSMNSKHLLGATFRINEGWANSCTASDVDLWITGGISSSTTWNNQPSWMTKLDSVSAARKNGQTGNCAPGPLAFNALAGVQAAATNGWPNLTLGLRAGDESDTNSWKRFQAGSATLQVDYNTIPTVGAVSTIPALSPQCVSGGSSPASNDPVMNSGTPTLAAVINDADTAETQEKGDFVWQSWNGTAWVAAGSGQDPIGRAPGSQTTFQIPSGSLTDATTYRWQVQIADPLMSPYTGTDLSAWSPWCEFIADFTPPPAPQVTGTVYTSGCAPSCGGVGTTGSFTLNGGASDVSKYLYGFTDPPSTPLTPSVQGGSVTFSFTPTHGGPTTLFVTSQDIGGNSSAETRYTFNVGTPAPAVGNWRLADTSDDTGAHPLTLVGGASMGVPAREVQDSALGLSGSGQYAKTGGTVLNTAQSFSVSAWARITSTSASQVVAAQAGTSASGFILDYDHGSNRWAFAGVSADVASPSTNFSLPSAAAPAIGAWTLLTGTYDAATRTASLYVNGVLQGTQVAAAPTWNATGPLLIGADWAGGAASAFLAGSISNVEAWQRVLQPGEVAALADPSGDPVGVYHFSDISPPPPDQQGSLTFDSSNYGNDLTLEGDAQIPASGAGHDGPGMLITDGGGWAQSSQQVLHTDQSFTVSTWVRIDGSALPTGNRWAISQAGTTASAFQLGYVSSPSPRWSFQMPEADTASPVTDAATSTVNLTTADLGVWHLLTGSFNAATGVMTLQVDGQVVATTTRTAAPWDASGSLLAGGGWQGGANVGGWIGAIDEMRIYQGVLGSPLGDWQFTSCTGSPPTCADQGTGNHALTLGAGASWGSGGYSGNGLSLSGSGTASTSAPVADTSTTFTASAWVKLASVPTSDAVVVAQAGAHQDFFELAYSASKGQWCATAYSGDAGSASASSACAGSVQTGAWTQLTGVFDPVDQTVSLYLDGALAATAADQDSWKAGGGLLIGGGLRNGAAAGFLTGSVDDVEVVSGAVADPSTLQ